MPDASVLPRQRFHGAGIDRLSRDIRNDAKPGPTKALPSLFRRCLTGGLLEAAVEGRPFAPARSRVVKKDYPPGVCFVCTHKAGVDSHFEKAPQLPSGAASRPWQTWIISYCPGQSIRCFTHGPAGQNQRAVPVLRNDCESVLADVGAVRFRREGPGIHRAHSGSAESSYVDGSPPNWPLPRSARDGRDSTITGESGSSLSARLASDWTRTCPFAWVRSSGGAGHSRPRPAASTVTMPRMECL